MYERPYIKEIQARIEEPRKFIQVILGPRQVGKTTMVNQLLQKLSLPYVYESADAVSATNSAWLTQVWETARLRMKAANVPEYLLVVDEIQKIENWSEIVKQQWDKDTREKYQYQSNFTGIFPIIDSERTHRVIGRTFRNVLSRSLVFC